MAKYSKAAGRKVETAMKEMKKGSLKTGSGKKVTDKKQAVAIGLSEAKKKGLKVPAKKAAAPKKASASKKAAPTKKAAAPKKATVSKKSAPIKKAATPKKGMSKKAAPAKKAAAPKKAPPASALASKPAAAPPAASKQNRGNNTQPVAKKKKPTAPPSPEMNYPPVEENSPMEAPVEEPNAENAILNDQKANPIPEDKYAVARDTYHGHTKPTASKSKIRPAGKKPLFN